MDSVLTPISDVYLVFVVVIYGMKEDGSIQKNDITDEKKMIVIKKTVQDFYCSIHVHKNTVR